MPQREQLKQSNIPGAMANYATESSQSQSIQQGSRVGKKNKQNTETDEHKQQCNLYNRGFGWEKAKKQTNKDIRCQESPSLTYFLGEIWLSDGSS